MPAYKDETTNTWYTKFYYTDWTGTTKQKKKRGFPTKREAAAWERDFLERQQGTPDMSFISFSELYLNDMKQRLKPSTMNSKENLIKNRILPFFKSKALNDIDSKMIRQWQNELLKESYTDTYLRKCNAQLSAMFNYAVKYYNLNENPCRKTPLIGSKKPVKFDFWTLDEYKEFRQYLKEDYIVPFDILYWTGLRIGELMALTLEDINFENKSININKSYQRINKKDIITKPKTASSIRTVYIPDFLSNEIKEYFSKIYDNDPKQRIFMFNKVSVKRQIESISVKYGLKKIKIHEIRHSHASLLIEQGFNPLLISERLGHDDIQTTLNTYSHLYPNKHGQMAAQLNNLK